MSEPWYHPSLSRLEAERRLLQCNKDGTFLIRESETINNALVLSFICGDRVYHCKILRGNDGTFRIASSSHYSYTDNFGSLREMVIYFSQPERGLPCPLLFPCSLDADESSDSDDFEEIKVSTADSHEEPCRSTESSCDWILDRDQIVLSSTVIGEGAWGRVLKGTYGGSIVAVKEIHKSILSPYNRQLFEQEINIASKCRHPCLLQFIGATNDRESPLFVTELLDTNLRAVLNKRTLKPKEITKIALDVAKGLNYLHLKRPNPIIHRDISSANVLLWKNGADWRAKISDYGAADFLRESMTACPGAAIYSAPEARTSRQSPKVDVYSFGVLLCEMSIRELPDVKTRKIQVAKVKNHCHRLLIIRCLRQNPDERPSMADNIEKMTEPSQGSHC